MENEKMIALTLASLLLVLATPSAYALPVIENISIQPDVLWMGNHVDFSLGCYDDAGFEIAQVSTLITGPVSSSHAFTSVGGNTYELEVGSFYLSESGSYTATIECINNQGSNVSKQVPFFISVLDGYVSSIIPNPAFLEDTIDIRFVVLKDYVPVQVGDGEVAFTVSLNGVDYPLLQPPAYASGWILKIDSPPSAGTYTIGVTAEYQGTSISNQSNMEVQDFVEFDIVSLDKTLLIAGNNMTVTVKANEKGTPISLQENHLTIQVNSANADILNITRNGDLFDVLIQTPNIVPGNYELKANFNYDIYSFSETRDVSYAVVIEGEILDYSSNGVDLTIKFISNDTGGITIFETDKDGIYYGIIASGIYDLKLLIGKSEVLLTEVELDDYDDSIRFFPVPDVTIPGMGIAGFFVVDVLLPYEDVSLNLVYSDQGVSDENALQVFQCTNWNPGQQVCNSNWNTYSPTTVNIVKNEAAVEVLDLGTFAVGVVKTLHTDFTFEKNLYNVGELVRISGLVIDETNAHIPDTEVTMELVNQNIIKTVMTGSSGTFSFEFILPQKEGNFTVRLTPKKSPFVVKSTEKSLLVEKSKGIFLIIPDSVKLERGKNRTFDFTITNTGQADVKNIEINISGIPGEFYDIRIPFIEFLPAKEERNVGVFFNVPADAGLKTYAGKFIVSGDDILSEGAFAFTIQEVIVPQEQKTEQVPIFSLPTFNLNFPTANVIRSLESNITAILVLVAGTFLLVYFLRKRKLKDYERVEVTNMLNDIKREINRGEREKEGGKW